jgi:hypothetical protein
MYSYLLRDVAMDKKVIPILMPQAGQSMEEGTILSWKAKIGEKIEVGQIIQNRRK